MSRHSCGCNEDTETVWLGVLSEFRSLSGCSVCREDVHLIGDVECFERVDCFLNNRQIAVASHDNSNFFHENPPFKKGHN